jgi:hypothetical protein
MLGVARACPTCGARPARSDIVLELAAASVAAVSAHALSAGADTCALYAQLNNATSNRIYRALGYRAAMEVLFYAFGSPTSRT